MTVAAAILLLLPFMGPHTASSDHVSWVGGPPVVGDAIAPFTLASPEGQPFSWRPKRTTVICFCAFWCDTWKEQLPRLKEARRDLAGVPADFLTVSVDGRWSELGRKASVGANLSDAGNRWCSSIGIDRVPYTLLVDSRGIVRWTAYGVFRSQDLVRSVRAASKREGGTIYLTFDDFPSPKGDDDLLDALRAADVRATFFCICARLESRAVDVRRAASEGHSLEIHGWNHDEAKSDLVRCRQTLQRFGGDGTLYRPHGSEYLIEAATMKRLSYPVCDPYDFQRPGPDELIRRISGQVSDGTVIQLHAGARDTIDVLPRLIGNLKKRGFTFGVLP